MTEVCGCSGNKDLADFVPVIVKGVEAPKNTSDCVEKLAGCIFVQNVEAPALSVITPVLWRGLNEKSETVMRRCLVIVDNMCKLVDDPREGQPLFSEILPLVEKRAEEISDPEAREMAEKTLATIKKLHAVEPKPTVGVKEMFINNGGDTMTWGEPITDYMEGVANALNKANNEKVEDWVEALSIGGNRAVIEKVMAKMSSAGKKESEEFHDDDETSPDLYKGSFSLAYGTLTLLRDTKLHLKKFKFYGLLGPNNCGKTTLMRAISREQVEGFPKRDELVTIFVEHEVEEREIEQEDGQ